MKAKRGGGHTDCRAAALAPWPNNNVTAPGAETHAEIVENREKMRKYKREEERETDLAVAAEPTPRGEVQLARSRDSFRLTASWRVSSRRVIDRRFSTTTPDLWVTDTAWFHLASNTTQMSLVPQPSHTASIEFLQKEPYGSIR